MKIIHICLAASYIEGYGYQENILPEIHSQMGNDVTVITSKYIFNSKYEPKIRENFDYINKYGVHVLTLNNSNRFGKYSQFGDFDGLYDTLSNENPNVIFVHGGQFVGLMDVVKYCKKHGNVKLYIDQHGDYYNMKIDNWKSKLVHFWFYGHWMRKAIPLTEKYWGVTPWRCQYLNEVYHIPNDKIDLLVMGGDDRYINLNQKSEIRNEIRKSLCINEEDFVIISGGKIDLTKNIHLLMKAVIKLNIDNLKLIIFGQPDNNMEGIIKELSIDKHIINIGWIDSKNVYDYYLASDLAVFPGTHSVLWEQTCACGLPAIFKDWEGMHHVDLGGNCIFLKKCDEYELSVTIKNIYEHLDMYQKMKEVSTTKCIKQFSYKFIARKSIGILNEDIK